MRDTITEAFHARFGGPPSCVSRAPGRLEILGNHTDYNEGFVLSCAIDKATWVAAAPVPGTRCTLVAGDLQGAEAVLDLNDIGAAVPGEWANYVKGVILEMRKRGATVGAFNGMIRSTIPLSAGMSSSAALEIASAYALGVLNNASFSPAEWARIGQGSENNYVGANTGLMDQFTSVMGRENQIVFTDFRTIEVQTVPFPDQAVLVVADSGVKHDLTCEYNERRERCEQAAAYFSRGCQGRSTLRDVTMDALDAAREDIEWLTYQRARHIIGENERVQRGIAALRSGDLAAFGQLLFESHQSSRLHFENSCPELDILVESAKSLPGCLGARLSGGGFGGISIHLVERADAQTYAQRLATAYHTRTGVTPDTMICAIAQGAQPNV